MFRVERTSGLKRNFNWRSAVLLNGKLAIILSCRAQSIIPCTRISAPYGLTGQDSIGPSGLTGQNSISPPGLTKQETLPVHPIVSKFKSTAIMSQSHIKTGINMPTWSENITKISALRVTLYTGSDNIRGKSPPPGLRIGDRKNWCKNLYVKTRMGLNKKF